MAVVVLRAFLAPCSDGDRAAVLGQSIIALCCVGSESGRANLAASGGGICFGGGRQRRRLSSLDTHSGNSKVEGG